MTIPDDEYAGMSNQAPDAQFARLVTKLMEKQELSDAELGRRLGVSRQSVRRWRQGIAHPKFRVLPKFAELLGVELEELWGGRPTIR
jgi:transcriptional regulator with XRE-family HTH domain